MDIQFYHHQKHKGFPALQALVQEFTAAVQVPTKTTLLLYMDYTLKGQFKKFTFIVGITKVIKNDQYNKKIGREKSTLYMRRYDYTEYNVKVKDDTIQVTFFDSNYVNPSLTFELKEGRERPYLIKVGF